MRTLIMLFALASLAGCSRMALDNHLNDAYRNYDQGNCEEAIEFYATALDGEIISMQRYGDAPENSVPAELADKIMHCVLAADDVIIMASDATSQQDVGTMSNISLSLDFDSAEEQQETFEALAEGGTVTMDLQLTFWGARFGMLTDKFGVAWMCNYDEVDEDEDDGEDEGESDGESDAEDAE